MTILIITVLLCLITIAIVVTGTVRHGWTNGYIISIVLVLVALAAGVVGYLS